MEHLSAAQRAKIRRLSTDGEAPEGEAAGEINVVPFLDILMNVLMFVLATITVTFTATIESKAAGRGPRTAKDDSLGLTVLVASEGFGVKARGGNVAPGCSDTGGGIAVPKKDGAYDFEGLRACVSHVKGTFQDERDATVTANPGVPYQTLVATLDAIRNDKDGKELFPDVSLGVAR
jgi:biopolymer transport protein ExbD